MTRTITATCLAAAFAVGLSAQTTGTAGTATQEPPAGGGQGRGGGPRTATGCLRAGDTAGTYMLTDVRMQGGGGRRGGDATTGGTTTGTGTTAGTGAGTTTGTGTGAGGADRSYALLREAIRASGKIGVAKADRRGHVAETGGGR